MKASMDLCVIVPFRNAGELTAMALRSLAYLPGTAQVLAIDNGSSENELYPVKKAIQLLRASGFDASIVHDPSPFNFQRMNNRAAEIGSCRSLLFMNNDARLAVQSMRLLRRMRTLISEQDIGAVGATLLLADRRRIQHIGVKLDSGGFASHYLAGESYTHWESLPTSVVSAVTAAFLMVDAEKFQRVGGFDERFIVCGGDVDLCLRLGEVGYKTIVCRDGWAIHDESATRNPSRIPSSDFVESYHSYIRGFDDNNGDPFCTADLPYGVPLWMADRVHQNFSE